MRDGTSMVNTSEVLIFFGLFSMQKRNDLSMFLKRPFWFRDKSAATVKTEHQDGLRLPGSHCISAKQGLQLWYWLRLNSNKTKIRLPPKGDPPWRACCGVRDDCGWRKFGSQNQHHNQTSPKQGINVLQIILLICIFSPFFKVVVHFPDLGLSDSWTILQLKELFRWDGIMNIKNQDHIAQYV